MRAFIKSAVKALQLSAAALLAVLTKCLFYCCFLTCLIFFHQINDTGRYQSVLPGGSQSDDWGNLKSKDWLWETWRDFGVFGGAIASKI